MQVVPFTSDYDQRFVTQLGDEKYVFDARWSERAQHWTVDITRDSDQQLLASCVPLLSGQDILAPYALGIGALVVTDLSQTETDPGPEDLGSRVIVTSLSPEELQQLRGALAGTAAGQVLPPAAAPISSGGGEVTPPASGGSGGGSGGDGGTTIVNTTQQVFNIVGALGFSQYAELADDTGDEVLVGRFVQMPGMSPNPLVALAVALLAAGTGTVRVYVGGTFEPIGNVGVPSGTLRGSASVSGAGENAYQITNSFANPGGIVPVKITMQSAAPATEVKVLYMGGGLA